jgi:penicillin-binding protein 1A
VFKESVSVRKKDVLRGATYLVFYVSVCAVGAVSYLLHNQSVDVTLFERYDPGKPTLVLDAYGNEWTRFAIEKREYISIEAVPKHVIQAFLAAEDWHFYTHCGLSFKGIVRSLLVNIRSGCIMQGASTITQQVVRLLFFGHKRTFSRKLKEQCLALLVERQFSKDQIMQAYLNQVYFGCGIYGVEAAAHSFWGIPVSQLSIDQAAVLAGIMRSPRKYCPLLHSDATEQRRNVVLGQMLHLEFISQDEYEAAVKLPVRIIEKKKDEYGLHAREYVRKKLEALVGQELYTGGFTVHTTLDPYIQRSAEHVFNKHIERIRKMINPHIDGALLTIEVATGNIRAMIGGADFRASKFNRALQARRQLGSVFKTIIYAAAMQTGMKFSDVVVDEPFIFVDEAGSIWEPKNQDMRFRGPITLAYALSRSNNVVAIKTFLKTGADRVIDLARKAGISDIVHPYPSLALGCVDVTLLQATGMFNLFANNGIYVEPHLVSRITDACGATIMRTRPVQREVMSPCISGQVLKVLGLGLARVRAALAQTWIDSEAAAKTGTTNDHRTCWFMGSTPELTTGVYIGCDDNRPIGQGVYPLHTAFPIWIALHRTLPTILKEFAYDARLKEVKVFEKSGRPASSDGKEVISLVIPR